MDVVDGHLHLFKALSDEYPRAIFDVMAPPERSETAARLLEAMDASGVDRAIFCALSPHDRFLAEVLEQYPGKFAGVAVHDFEDLDPLSTLRGASTRASRESGSTGWRASPVPTPSRWRHSPSWPPCATRA